MHLDASYALELKAVVLNICQCQLDNIGYVMEDMQVVMAPV